MAESFASLKATVKIPTPPPQPDLPVATVNKLPPVKLPLNSYTNGEVKNGDNTVYLSPTLTNMNGDSETMIFDQSPTFIAPTTLNITITNNHLMPTNNEYVDDSQKTVIALPDNASNILPHEMPDEVSNVSVDKKKSCDFKQNTGKMNAPSGLSYGSIDGSSNKYNQCKFCRKNRW